MSKRSSHSSGIQLRPPRTRIEEARGHLERLHLLLAESGSQPRTTNDLATERVVYRARAFWVFVVFELAELRERTPSWPHVRDADVAGLARRVGARFAKIFGPPLFEDAEEDSAISAIRSTALAVLDALDEAAVETRREGAGAARAALARAAGHA